MQINLLLKSKKASSLIFFKTTPKENLVKVYELIVESLNLKKKRDDIV
jgi:hypothetical protein